jgi:hypothetical protein
LAAPSGYGGVGIVDVRKNDVQIAMEYSDGGYGSSYTANNAESGNFTYQAQVAGGMGDASFIPGNYTISTTLTCIGQ